MSVEPDTERALQVFNQGLRGKYEVLATVLFGSRARGTHHKTSDADVAVLLRGKSGRRMDVALVMADIAFDVMLETGILIEAIPFWEDEWNYPEIFNNPALIKTIKREGVDI